MNVIVENIKECVIRELFVIVVELKSQLRLSEENEWVTSN